MVAHDHDPPSASDNTGTAYNIPRQLLLHLGVRPAAALHDGPRLREGEAGTENDRMRRGGRVRNPKAED